MQKEFKILFNFGIWFILLFVVCLIGSSNVFALEYNNIGYVHTLSGVNGEVTIDVTYETESNAPLVINRNQIVYTQLKAMNVFISNYSFEANRQYQVEMEFPYQQLQYANTYQVFDQNTNESCSLNYSESIFNSQWPRWNWSCPHATNSIYLKVYNSNNTAITSYGEWSWNYMYMRYTNTSISSDVQDTDVIINNNNMNTDRIINNNNSNTDRIIEENKKNFNDCHQSYNLFDLNGVSNTTIASYNNGIISINWDSGYNLYLLNNGSQYLTNLDSTKIYTISFKHKGNSIKFFDTISNRAINTNNDTDYVIYNFTVNNPTQIRLNINRRDTSGTAFIKDLQVQEGSTATDYEPYGKEICTNKLDETKDAINGVKNALTDDSPIDMSSLGDTAGWLPAGPIDSIINLPLNLFNNLLNALNKTCQPINIPLPYVDRDLPIPCISTIFNQIDGLPNFWNWVGAITSIVILYRYLLALYKYYDDLTTMKANFISDFGGAP